MAEQLPMQPVVPQQDVLENPSLRALFLTLFEQLPWRLTGSPPNTQAAENKKDKDSPPKMSPEIRETLGIDSQHEFSDLPQSEQLKLLGRIFDNLGIISSSHGPATGLRCLQDFSYYFNSPPPSLYISDIKFSRTDRMGHGGEATAYRGRRADQDIVVREMLLNLDQRDTPYERELVKSACAS
ncbi:hypothetical protein DL93DRAFT_1505401 [Clavulina sp. PMI_390]|nr:hypothetical protein DL93DRAFT_1505401 [Clavulina sp. PMI_390]